MHSMTYTRETLVAELRKNGIAYLAPSDAVATEPIYSPAELITAILEQSDARLKLALVPLFIRQPHLSRFVPDLVDQLDPVLALDLQTYYMAAVYLQRHWRTRLSRYLGVTSLLPDLYSQQLGLSSAEEYHGKMGLYELADVWKERSQYPFNRLAALKQTIDLFFGQLQTEKWSLKYASES